MEAEYEATDAFREAWKLRTRDVIGKAAWRRQKLNKRVSNPGVHGHTGARIVGSLGPAAMGKMKGSLMRQLISQQVPW